MRNDEKKKIYFVVVINVKLQKKISTRIAIYTFSFFHSLSLSSHRRRHLRNDERRKAKKKNLDRLVSEHKNWGNV
jgi:hypothetical protein